MIRSLRLRFFLITWPLIVLAVVGVSFVFERWTEVQIVKQFDRQPRPNEFVRREVEALTQRWVASGETDSGLAAQLGDVATRSKVDAIVVGAHGEIVATSDPSLHLAGPPHDLVASEPLAFERVHRNSPAWMKDLVEVTGRPVRDAAGALRAMVYVAPTVETASEPTAEMRADARRTLWQSVAIASAVAAVLALLLARPLVGQVRRLAAAAARVRSGDLSARVEVRSADELGRMEQAFNAMAGALQQAETHKRNLVHDVAHELRTPLTNIVGILEAIEDGLRAPDAATCATLRAEAGLLAALVHDLQELSLAESGQLAFDLVAVDVVAEARQTIDAMRSTAACTLTGPEREPVFARADPTRLRQVLRNLLRNAIAHTPASGQVRVAVEARAGEVGILVSDTGRGIPAEHLALVWERFHRVDAARDRAAGGRGLGLAIVKQFVEHMGGRVAVTSLEGKGSTFEVWLREAR